MVTAVISEETTASRCCSKGQVGTTKRSRRFDSALRFVQLPLQISPVTVQRMSLSREMPRGWYSADRQVCSPIRLDCRRSAAQLRSATSTRTTFPTSWLEVIQVSYGYVGLAGGASTSRAPRNCRLVLTPWLSQTSIATDTLTLSRRDSV